MTINETQGAKNASIGFASAGSAGTSEPKVKVTELYDLVVDYAKQEVIDPIRGAYRWLAYGVVAAVMMSIGLVLGTLGVLRLVQSTSLGTSSGWSWLAYLITLTVCAAFGGVAFSRIRRGTLAR